ncbi:Zinc finger BED domain-containing protein 4, partial [Frankliniella fusca]
QYESADTAASASRSRDVQLPRLAEVGTGGKRPRTSGSGGGHQMTIDGSLQRASSFKAGGEMDATLRDALLFMEMRQNLPLSFSDGEGFRHFASKAVPLWSPPSRRTMTRAMEDKYEVLSVLVKDMMEELSTVCLTADCWTEKHTTQSYLGVTAHFPVNVEMRPACIGRVKLDQSHTGQYLSGKLPEFCADWHIDPLKVEAVTVDNAENIKLAVKTAFGESKLVNCFAHTLNLIPKAALGMKSDKDAIPNVPGVPEVIKKVKAIVTLSHTSNNFADEIRRVQVEHFDKNPNLTMRLINDVVTRWGSTYMMLKRFLEMQRVLLLATSKFPAVVMLNAAELASLKSIMGVLEPIHDATTEMSSETSTSISKVIPLVALLQKAVQNVAVDPADAVARRFKQFILDEMVRRFGYGEQNTRQAASTIVGPRFMEVYFQSPLAVSKARKFLETEIVKEMIMDSSEPTDTNASQGNAQAGGAAGAVGAGAPSRLWSSHAEMAASRVSAYSDDINGRAMTQLRSYLQRNIVPVTENPLQIWEALKSTYPQLYRVARRLLNVMAGSVPSERFFSTAGEIMDDNSTRLTPKHFQQRIFLKSVELSDWEKARLKDSV